MNTRTVTAEELFALSEDELYSLIGQADMDAAAEQGNLTIDLLRAGTLERSHQYQKMATPEFFRNWGAKQALIAHGKKVAERIWPNIKSAVCSAYKNDEDIVDNKTLFDIILATLGAAIGSNLLLAALVVLLIKAGLTALCAAE